MQLRIGIKLIALFADNIAASGSQNLMLLLPTSAPNLESSFASNCVRSRRECRDKAFCDTEIPSEAANTAKLVSSFAPQQHL
jgi:hypothetical protein